MPSYIATGQIRVCGRAELESTKVYTPRYAANSLVYIVAKADQGVLERVAVRKIIFHEDEMRYVYEDSTHRLWLEDELCSRQDAVDAKARYTRRKMVEAQKRAMNCGPT